LYCCCCLSLRTEQIGLKAVNMTCEYVFRDVTDIYSRLFNHRAAIQGLANNFVKEFEERRGDSEHISLTRTLELLTDCRDRAHPDTVDGLEEGMGDLEQAVKSTTQKCNRILLDCQEKKTDWLESERQRRRKEWSDFMVIQETRKNRIDEEYNSKVRTLEGQYAELEDKLKAGTKRVL